MVIPVGIREEVTGEGGEEALLVLFFARCQMSLGLFPNPMEIVAKRSKRSLNMQLLMRVHVVEQLLVVIELVIPLLRLVVPEVIPQGDEEGVGLEELGLLAVLVYL